MSITFLHSSDWHIGKPFGRFGDVEASVLRRARLTVIDRLADAAAAGGAGHVFVAGDLFDRPSLADRDLRAPLEQMRAHGDLTWHVIPGNHDPAVTGGVWERLLRDGLPANVRLYLDARAVEIAPGCWLLPAPLSAKALTDDPTEWMDAAETPAGSIRIGLAHGSVQGFGGDQAASISIAPDRARRARLDYLALGDWHGQLEIGPRTAYCGTPEPDDFLENGAGCALLVRIEGSGARPVVSRRETGQHRWQKRKIEIARQTDLAHLEGEIEGWGARASNSILAIEVTGRIAVAEERELRRRLDRLEARVFHLERRLQRLVVCAAQDDLAQLSDGVLREIGRELSEVAAGGGADAQVASRALRHFFEIVDSEAVRSSVGGRV